MQISNRAVARSLAAAMLSTSLAANAENMIVVSTTSDVLSVNDGLCSLREALANANLNAPFSQQEGECAGGSGETTDVIVLASGQLYQLTLVGGDDFAGDLDISDDLRIESDALALAHVSQTIVGERVFDVVDADVELLRLELSAPFFNIGSVDGSGVRAEHGALVIRESLFSGLCGVQGGAIHAVGGSLLLSGAVVKHSIGQEGGAVYASDAAVTLEATQVLDGQASEGGAVHATGATTLTLRGAQIGRNISTESGGGIYSAGLSVEVLENSQFFDNQAGSGGAVFVDGSALTVRNSGFTQNTTNINNGAGGAIHTNHGADIETTSFTANKADFGGAIAFVPPNQGQTTLSINSSDFMTNTAFGGGAIAQLTGPADHVGLVVDASHFEGNEAIGPGGVAGAIYGGRAAVTGSTFVENNSTGQGGAIVMALDLTIHGGGFDANESAGDGGALYSFGTLSMSDTLLVGNVAQGVCGGACAEASAVVVRTQVIGNLSHEGVGGLGVGGNDGATSRILQSVIADNETLGYSGGMVLHGSVLLANSTVTGNSAGEFAGGIYASGDIEFVNVTVMGNGPGGDLSNDGAVGAINSIIGTVGQPACEGFPIDSSGYNLFGADSCASLHVSDRTDDPLLSAFGDYGGQTLGYLPTDASPAVDAGDPVACASQAVGDVDQRGFSRDVGTACDIGALEFAATVEAAIFRDGFEAP